MLVNSNIARMLEDEYLQLRVRYRSGSYDYQRGVPINNPPTYSTENETQGWLMGWRSAEYEDKEA